MEDHPQFDASSQHIVESRLLPVSAQMERGVALW